MLAVTTWPCSSEWVLGSSMAAAPRLVVSRQAAGVVDPEGDGADAVSVLVDVAGDLGVGAERGGEDEADFALLKDVAGAVAEAGFGAGVGDERHAKGGAVEVCGLAALPT